jgi:c-di-GMP-binding flagellar brake protein YcgR
VLFSKIKKKPVPEKAQVQAPRPPRYRCVARVGINGFEGEAVLRNISSGGFLMESRTYATITVGEHYTMQIKPEAASGVQLFELGVEVRWIQSSETKFSAGFLVVTPPANRALEKYLDYIKTQTRN